jgi:phospholipid N-methyltransferase
MNIEEKIKTPLAARFSATCLFVVEAVFRPHQIGAVLPSSQKLSAAMARWLPRDGDAYALELGPGTGSVTEALINRGLREDRLIAIEKSPKMAELLRARFPRAIIITGDAFQLDQLLKQHAPHVDGIGPSAISGPASRMISPKKCAPCFCPAAAWSSTPTASPAARPRPRLISAPSCPGSSGSTSRPPASAFTRSNRYALRRKNVTLSP